MLFPGVINTRLNNCCEEIHVISGAQFGFSTANDISILNTTVQKVLNDNGRLNCAFIDMQTCFAVV